MDEDWDDGATGLGRGMSDASALTVAFSDRLQSLAGSIAEAERGLQGLEKGFSTGLRRAFEGVAFDGAKLSDALRGLGRSMADTVYSAAIRPVADHFGGLLSEGIGALVGGAAGQPNGAFTRNRVMPFATGGVISGPTTFPVRGGLGLMGEAGPEAILPLARGADGRLGVQTGGGGAAPNVTINVTTPDVEGFRRSQGQIAADLGRLIARGQRNR